MKKIFYLYSKSLLSKLTLMAALILGGANSAWGEDNLTVYSGENTSNKFPISGGYVNYGARSEFIIAKDLLNELFGKNILKLTFYHQAASTLRTWGNAEFKIYLKEVDQTTFSSTEFLGSYDSPAFTGTLEPRNDAINGDSQYEMNVILDTPFNYTGKGSLLIGVYCSTTGSNYNYVYFYGTSSSNGGLYSYINNSGTPYTSRDGFRLKTTLTYEDATLPIMSVNPPAEGNDFGYVTENMTKSYTVKNIGAGTMDVNITSSNAVFSLSESSLTGITNDGTGKTFNVTFNYNADAPQPHNANITITPTFEDAVPEVINVTAGPEVEINEDKETTLSYGSGKTVFVKYIAKDGWNTICMPISLSGSMNTLFGSGWKAYKFSSYENHTLTFTKDDNLTITANPYLVYVDNATSPVNGFVIEDIMVYNKNAESVSPTGTTATFQGTYAPITAGNFTNEMYGVTSSGQVRPGDGVNANMKGYRAYFTGVSAPSTPGARISIVFEDDGETTDLGFVKMVDPEATDVYTLSGQKVKKGSKGIYIVNGRKVVIK